MSLNQYRYSDAVIWDSAMHQLIVNIRGFILSTSPNLSLLDFTEVERTEQSEIIHRGGHSNGENLSWIVLRKVGLVGIEDWEGPCGADIYAFLNPMLGTARPFFVPR